MKRREEKTVYVFDSLGQPAEIYNSEKEATKKQKSVFDWISSVIASFVVIFVIFAFVFRIVQVSGESMLPTLNDGDWLALTTVGNELEYGDIIVATPPSYTKGPVIKRVIALEGDEVFIDFELGEVLVNGKKLNEPYINTQTNVKYDVEFPITVPEGCVFAMGDNRNHSLDSRSSTIGMIEKKYVLGKVITRLLPFEKIEYNKIEEAE